MFPSDPVPQQVGPAEGEGGSLRHFHTLSPVQVSNAPTRDFLHDRLRNCHGQCFWTGFSPWFVPNFGHFISLMSFFFIFDSKPDTKKTQLIVFVIDSNPDKKTLFIFYHWCKTTIHFQTQINRPYSFLSLIQIKRPYSFLSLMLNKINRPYSFFIFSNRSRISHF